MLVLRSITHASSTKVIYDASLYPMKSSSIPAASSAFRFFLSFPTSARIRACSRATLSPRAPLLRLVQGCVGTKVVQRQKPLHFLQIILP